jgi:hypothetical protein
VVRLFISAIIFVQALVAGSLFAGNIKAPIEPNLESALAKSISTGRPVIVDFHAFY